jgi:hypothetical protein
MAACIVVVALRAVFCIGNLYGLGSSPRQKQQRHKRDRSFSDLFDRITAPLNV